MSNYTDSVSRAFHEAEDALTKEYILGDLKYETQISINASTVCHALKVMKKDPSLDVYEAWRRGRTLAHKERH